MRTVICCECESCGDHFDSIPSRLAGGRGKYCSRPCYDKGQTTGATVICCECELCGGHFDASPTQVAIGSGKYCSRSCRDKASTTRVEKKCTRCGAVFLPALSAVAKFCSRKCAAAGRTLTSSRQADDSIDLWAESSDVPHVREYRMGWWSIDLAFPQCKVAIELDGVYWHSMPKNIESDARKDAMLTDKGWQIYRIPMESGESPKDISERISGACLVMGVA